jgi:hypothetical protein
VQAVHDFGPLGMAGVRIPRAMLVRNDLHSVRPNGEFVPLYG